jgi:CAAX prenyl protease-like protein
MSDSQTTNSPALHRNRLGDDVAYILPMGVFLVLVWVGGQWKSLYPAAYVTRVLIVAALLAALWRHFTKIRWNRWWLGVIVGVAGIFQWVGMQLWLQNHFEFFRPKGDAFNPFDTFKTPAVLWGFIAVRLVGAVLVVPVMEELFWRDYLWRQIIAPNDFKLAHVGEWDPTSVLVVCIAFATVHGNWWLTAIVWGAMIAALLLYTKSLGACIVAHATTNLLLGLWVLKTHQWSFW